MPLDGKTVSKLVKDLDAYHTEKEWVDRDAIKVAVKGSDDDVAWLKERQHKAKVKLNGLERDITKAIISGFPERVEREIREEVSLPKKPRYVTVPADEPDVIRVPKVVLERINDTMIAQSDQIELFTTVTERQLVATEALSRILAELKDVTVADVRERTDVNEITYPSGAATVTIPAGTTELDLWSGDVTLGDGTEGRMSDSLERLDRPTIRSINIEVTKAYMVEIDGKADHAMAADDTLVQTGISCRSISITVTEEAKLKFWGSTNPNATLEGAKTLVVAPADELQLFDDEVIRDTAAHDSLIFDYSDYTMVTFYIANGLDQDISARVYGNRINSITDAVTIGAAFTVSADDEEAKAVTAAATGMMPFMFVRVTPSVTPTSGNVNVYAISRYTS